MYEPPAVISVSFTSMVVVDDDESKSITHWFDSDQFGVTVPASVSSVVPIATAREALVTLTLEPPLSVVIARRCVQFVSKRIDCDPFAEIANPDEPCCICAV